MFPKLRFKEFDGDWLPYVLKDFVSFRKGKGISKADISEDGINECIRYGELYTTYGQVIRKVQSKTYVSKSECVLSQAGDVLIPASGETQIDIATASCVLKEDVILSGDLNILSHKENGEWLAYYLSSAKKLDIAQLAQGNSVVHLYSSQLKDLKINKPSKEEQTKIVTFLSAVDEKISQLTKKHELLSQYKQGMMQKLFSQQIRFKADDGSEFGEWNKLKFKDVIKIKYGKDHKKLDEGNIPVYGSGGLMRLVNKSLYIGESILIPRKGTLSNLMFVDEEFWTVDTMFFSIPKFSNIAKYIFHHLKLLDLTSMNVGSAVPSMTTKVLNDLDILYPCENTLKEFNRLVTDFYNRSSSLNSQNETLAKLRDTLLPKLMSGELRIADAAALVDEAI